METLKLYLDSVFAAAGDTEEVRRVKAEMLDNMEDKYHELKASGASENEAIGAVIADFGNVDEIFVEMGIAGAGTTGVNSDASGANADASSAADNAAPIYPLLASTQIDNFIDATKRSAQGISLGILLIFLGAIQLVLNPVIGFISANLSAAILFLFIMPAVGLFIHNGMRLSPFKDIEEGHFRLDAGKQVQLKIAADKLRSYDSRKTITGVFIIFAGVAALLFGNSFPIPHGSFITVAVLLIAVAIAVRIFIIHFMECGAYDKLLQRRDYAPERRKSDTMIGAVAAFYWPLVVAIYLGWSLAFDAWDISWIIWPVAGVLFGGIAAFIPEFRKATCDD